MTLYDLVFSSINAPLTYLLIGLTAYRVVVTLVGLDFDLDLDFDMDVDIDASVDSSGIDIDEIANYEVKNENVVSEKTRSLKWWQVILIYFNFTELPFMFTFTAWIFFWWFLTVFATYFTGSYDNSFGFIVFALAVIPALILNKIFTTPFKRIFSKLERKGVLALDLLGREGVLDSDVVGDKLGRVKLKVESDPIIIYAKSLDGKPLKTGDQVLIIKESKDKKYYYIKNNY